MHCVELVAVFFICYKFSFPESDTVTSSGGYVVEDLKGFCTIFHTGRKILEKICINQGV
jgi:hypothetical protein